MGALGSDPTSFFQNPPQSLRPGGQGGGGAQAGWRTQRRRSFEYLGRGWAGPISAGVVGGGSPDPLARVGCSEQQRCNEQEGPCFPEPSHSRPLLLLLGGRDKAIYGYYGSGGRGRTEHEGRCRGRFSLLAASVYCGWKIGTRGIGLWYYGGV